MSYAQIAARSCGEEEEEGGDEEGGEEGESSGASIHVSDQNSFSSSLVFLFMEFCVCSTCSHQFLSQNPSKLHFPPNRI